MLAKNRGEEFKATEKKGKVGGDLSLRENINKELFRLCSHTVFNLMLIVGN
jgi:hypothetical protein